MLRPKIQHEFYQDYSNQLFLLIPKIKQTRTPFTHFDLFYPSNNELRRVIVKMKHSYLFPKSLRKKFSQSYSSPGIARHIEQSILLYFNTYFFFSSPVYPLRGVDLSKEDGEGIFTGQVNLLISGLKESLRRLSSRLPSMNLPNPPDPPVNGCSSDDGHSPPSPAGRPSLSPSGWDHHSLQFPPMPLPAVIPSPPALPPEPPHYSRVTFDSFTLDSDLSLDFDFQDVQSTERYPPPETCRTIFNPSMNLDFADSFQFFVPEMDEDDFLYALSHPPEEEDP